jgi:hypothetical protein
MRQWRFEIGIGARRLSAADSDHGLLVSLSIGDLNGAAYWLAR